MALAPLTWKLLGPSAPTSTTGSAIISTIKEDFIVSSSFWTVVETENSGSLSMVVTPRNNDLTGSSANRLHVVVANNVTGSGAYRSPHTNANIGTRIQVGITPESGTFKDFQHDNPFGQSHRWSKYLHCATTTDVSSSFIMESEESFLLCFKTTANGAEGAIVGAVLESFSSASGERVTGSTGRVYGMLSGGPSAWNTSFWDSTTTFIDTSTSANNVSSGIFAVSGGNATDEWRTIFRTDDGISLADDEFTTVDGSQVGLPPSYTNSVTTNAEAVGRARGFFQTEHDKGLVEHTSSSQITAYTVAASFTSDVDTLLFAPASGSVEAGVDFGGNM